MLRLRLLTVALVGAGIIAAVPTVAAGPSQQMSRYERHVHDAQKRLTKHRKAKAKELHKRRIRKAKRMIKQQRREQQGVTR